MGPILHHAALGLAAAALAAAALRLAAHAGPSGLARVVAAAPLGAAAAVLEALGLGLVGWGTSPVALLVAALVTWLAARRWLPTPVRGCGSDLAAWWRGLSPAGQAAAAAAAGVFAVWVVWMLRHPEVGIDGSAYHLPEALAWLHDGRPGSLHASIPFLPVENYPLTNEVATAWLLGLSRGYAVITVYEVAIALLLGAATWVGVRALRVPPAVSLLCVLVVFSLPPVVQQLNGPYTDLPALAWLVCAGALCALCPRWPATLGIALVALGLAVGTKTTTAPAAVVLLAATLVLGRPRLAGRALLAGAVAACLVGGVWYARNLLLHGWPLWPFTSGPTGDRVPAFIKLFDARFLDRPRVTIQQSPKLYREAVGALIVVFPSAVVLAAVRRRRDVVLAVAATVLLAFVWSVSPFTGRPDNPLFGEAVISTTRYLLPALAAGVLALALAARPPGRLAGAVLALLMAGLAVNVAELADIGFPYLPGVGTLLAGAVAGLLGWGVWRILGAWSPRPPAVALPLLAIALGVALVPAANGFPSRHGQLDLRYQRDVIGYFDSRPGFADGTRPIYAYPLEIGVLGGDRLAHPLRLLETSDCARLRAIASRAWIVTEPVPPVGISIVDAANRRVDAVARCLTPRFGPLRDLRGYRVYGPAT